MANELQTKYATGQTLNAILVAAPTTAIAMTEGAGGIYSADFPSGTAAGVYPYYVAKQAGGAWAASDEVVAVGVVIWNGEKEVYAAVPGDAMNLADNAIGAGTITDAAVTKVQAGLQQSGEAVTLPATAPEGYGGTPSAGADQCTLTLKTTGGTPIADADVWITSDEAGDTVVAGTSQTNSSGSVVFMLDAGSTYYRWAQKDGINFTNPVSFVAVAD